MSSNHDPIHVLNHLLILCTDAIAGYHRAAEGVDDPNIHRVLEQNASDREEIASVLTYKLVELGYKPAHAGSIVGSVHRAWLLAMVTLDHGDVAGLLKACEMGERETLTQFSAALAKPLPADVHAVIQSQLGRVLLARAALDQARVDIGRRRSA
jgi:uncharacterized protein (TIGR02284 family)